MAYYFECIGCDSLFTNHDCACPQCGAKAISRLTTGQAPAKTQFKFAPEYSPIAAFDAVAIQGQGARPTRLVAASILLILALCAFGVIGGESKAMEACQRSHSYDVCFSTLNP